MKKAEPETIAKETMFLKLLIGLEGATFFSENVDSRPTSGSFWDRDYR